MGTKDIDFVRDCAARVLGGENLDEETLYRLTEIEDPEAIALLEDKAEEITRKFCPAKFDTCSIVNARSGSCSENCNGVHNRPTFIPIVKATPSLTAMRLFVWPAIMRKKVWAVFHS